MRGAEAVMEKARLMGKQILVKVRIAKRYRMAELDQRLRRERTRQEARLLHKAKLAGVACPTVLFVDEYSIGMSRMNGKRPKMSASEAEKAGEMLAKLHNGGIIHGDFTPANLLEDEGGLCAIDFGLGFFSRDLEDKAIDVLTMLRSIKEGEAFLQGYSKISGEHKKVEARIEEIRKRARYA